jgi:hypothetical protein
MVVPKLNGRAATTRFDKLFVLVRHDKKTGSLKPAWLERQGQDGMNAITQGHFQHLQGRVECLRQPGV